MSIEIRHISKTFGAFEALHDINLTVPDGELMALLGPSGCGKTTLLRIVAGLETTDPAPDAAILFENQDVARIGAGSRQVGFVFQHYALFRHMTVFENIAFGLRVRPRHLRPSREEIRRRVLELLKLIQLDSIHDRYPSQLSGGQRQRVALARALATEPRVLLLDEPFGALDARVRQDLRRWLRRLHDEIHVTSVFVTHDQEEALEVADRIVVMNAGRIEQIGTPDEVYHHPRTAFVMSFLGRVNIFHGRADAAPVEVAGTDVAQVRVVAGEGDTHILVRPHDLDLSLESLGPHSFPGIVLNLNAAGATVRVEVQTDLAGAVFVETTQEQQRLLKLAVGARVFVTPRQMKVFPAAETAGGTTPRN